MLIEFGQRPLKTFIRNGGSTFIVLDVYLTLWAFVLHLHKNKHPH